MPGSLYRKNAILAVFAVSSRHAAEPENPLLRYEE